MPATGRQLPRRPTPASSAHPAAGPTTAATNPRTGPRLHAKGSAGRRTTGSSRSPWSSPAAASQPASGRTRPGARCRGTRSRTAPTRLARRSCATPDPAAGRPVCHDRGRHRRRHLQQLTDPRLYLVDQRPPRRPVVTRGSVIAQRLAHRVLRDPHRPRDHLDRHSLRTVQPADLSPVLH